MAWPNTYGPAEDVTAIKLMLDAAADAAKTADPADPRTLDQLRFDALAALAWASLDSGHLGGCEHAPRLGARHGRAAAVAVTVPLSTLIGLDDTPAQLAGYGPITAEVARRIAAAGTWRRLLTDPATGALLDHGQTRHTPPQDLIDHLIARDRTCRFPTCSQPARRCQIDHTIPAGAPGWTTSAGNTGPLSGGCHNGKTHAGRHLEQPSRATSDGGHPPATPTRSNPNQSAPSPWARNRNHPATPRSRIPATTSHRSDPGEHCSDSADAILTPANDDSTCRRPPRTAPPHRGLAVEVSECDAQQATTIPTQDTSRRRRTRAEAATNATT